MLKGVGARILALLILELNLFERPWGRRQFDFGIRFREKNAFVAGPKYYGNLDELASKGEVATCSNRSHWAWQARDRKNYNGMAVSPSWQVSQDNNPGPASFSTAYQVSAALQPRLACTRL